VPKEKKRFRELNRVSSSLGRKRDLQKEIYKKRFTKRDVRGKKNVENVAQKI